MQWNACGVKIIHHTYKHREGHSVWRLSSLWPWSSWIWWRFTICSASVPLRPILAGLFPFQVLHVSADDALQQIWLLFWSLYIVLSFFKYNWILADIRCNAGKFRIQAGPLKRACLHNFFQWSTGRSFLCFTKEKCFWSVAKFVFMFTATLCLFIIKHHAMKTCTEVETSSTVLNLDTWRWAGAMVKTRSSKRKP
jgi:hypothetical protein